MKFKLAALVAIGALSLNGCGDTAKDDEEDAESGQVAGSGGGGSGSAAVSSADDVGDLKLSSAFSLQLPAALSGDSGSSLRLASRKSMEACQMGETIREATRSLGEVGNFFCHIEAEKEKILFGVKTRITFQGQEFAKIWVDDSEIASDKIRIGFCSQEEQGANSQIISITGLSDNGPLGTIINKGEFEEDEASGTFHRSVDFDMTVAGVSDVTVLDKHTWNGETFNRKVALKMLEDGISEAILAARGEHRGETFQERGRALFDGTYGVALFENAGTHESQEYSFRRRAFFNDDGEVVASNASEKFASDGDLFIAESSLPKYLDEDFAPDDLDGWVKDGCSDYETEVTLDPESEAHQMCDGDRDEDYVDCWSEDSYESGEEL